MFCYVSKQPFAFGMADIAQVKTAPFVTAVLADNLLYFMEKRGMTQAQLAKRSGLGQTTISLYLRPGARGGTASGTAPSPTLARVQALADALGVELWELLRPLTPAQRDLIRSVDAVIAERTSTAEPQTDSRKRRAAGA
jgi:transcriptional regulator with XRE-family HTH domain